MNLDQRTGLDDSDYLNIRFSKLKLFLTEMFLLMIDEIYLSKTCRIKWRTGFLVFD